MALLCRIVVKGSRNHFLLRAPQIIGCHERLAIKNQDILRNETAYPTHNFILGRKISVSRKVYDSIIRKKIVEQIKKCDGKNNDEKNQYSGMVLFLSFTFNYKFFFYTLLDRSVQYHINMRFLSGASEAFLYVIECFKNKTFNHLSEIVTPEVLSKLEDVNGPLANLKPQYFQIKALHIMSVRNIDLRIDRETEVKTIEVLIRYTYFRKTYKDSKSDFCCFYFIFVRTYGKDRKDSQWLIKDIKVPRIFLD